MAAAVRRVVTVSVATLVILCVGFPPSLSGLPVDGAADLLPIKERLRENLEKLLPADNEALTRQAPSVAAVAAVGAAAPSIFQTMFQTIATNAFNKFFDELAKLSAPAFFDAAMTGIKGLSTMRRNLTDNMFNWNKDLSLAGVTDDMLSRIAGAANEKGDVDGGGGARFEDPAALRRKTAAQHLINTDGSHFTGAVLRALDAAVSEVLEQQNRERRAQAEAR